MRRVACDTVSYGQGLDAGDVLIKASAVGHVVIIIV
jgi:hypothetical protein